MHRVFDSPRDRILFDTGHQAYVHKMLTGRAGQFDTLRQQGGLSGYPSRAESEHDWVENSHASTALSYADGMAKAYPLRGEDDHVVAVIGDGALTGGMAWEALNNIAADNDRRLVIVVNDNGRSYTPTVGGLADHLDRAAHQPAATSRCSARSRSAQPLPRVVGPAAYEALHAVKKGIKDALAPQGMFEDLGLKYVGPVDGHDRRRRRARAAQAKSFGGPVIVHVVTPKGHGYDSPAPTRPTRCTRPAPFDPETGERGRRRTGRLDRRCSATRSSRIADERPDVVGDHRRDAATRPASTRSPTSTPTGSSTSASPSSTPSPAPPGSRWAACTRSSRSTRRSSTAPSTRCCSTWRCTGCG